MAVQRDKVIASAEKLVAKGKIEPAIKEYERLLDDNPNDVNTLNRIGDLWVRINRNDEGVRVFTKIAEHYSKDGFFLKAIAIFKKINKLDPSKLDIYAKLADLYAKQGLAMEAKSQYQVLADYYLKHGDPGNALAIYRKISELDPNSINVHVKLADLYSQNNQTAEALKEYDRVGRMLLKRGMLDEAVQVFRKALKIDAGNIDLVDSLVTALLEAKDYENATQIIDTSMEANREHPRLLALLGRTQLARGDSLAARATLERGVAANPEDAAAREALADVYLKQSDADGALRMLAPLAERALAKNEGRTAVELLNRVLRVDSGHAATLERLVAVYVRLNEETNILASMNSLAEAHVGSGRYEEASRVLDRLIQREPQNAQHRNKLAFVRQQMGGVDAAPVRPRTVDTPMPPLEIDEPAPSFDYGDDDGMTLDLDASDAMDLDLGSFQAAPGATPASAATDDGAGDDLDFITEHLTEAEVFAKYGLAEKAAEHLRTVIDRAPKYAIAHERLYKVLLDEGDVAGARAAATRYVALLDERGEIDLSDAVRNEFIARGQTLAPAPKPMPAAPAPPPLIARELAAEEEIELDLDSDGGLDFENLPMELDTTADDVEPAYELPSIEEPEPVLALEMPVIEFETIEPQLESTAAFTPASAPEPQFDSSLGAELEMDQFELSDSSATDAPLHDIFETDTSFAADDFGTIAASGFGDVAIEEVGEIDFYIEQELYEEARRKLDALSARHPDNAELTKRRERLDRAATVAASASIPTPPPAQPAPPVAPSFAPTPLTLSRDEIEHELLSAIPDDDDDFGFGFDEPEIAAAPVAAAPAAPAPPPVDEGNLFADEDDFFDLAAELEEELADDEVVSLSEEEQSLEEIFKEFKKGVEQQLDSEDYDTHYNLGIAYKEMGLIDEAIGEFQLASKDPKRAVECASMLGLCFLEKGMPQLAIKWYRKGLEMPEITEEEHMGLLYDLGVGYMEVGDTDNAQKAFMEVYGMNSNYRDIVSRIKQLEDARK
jgi:tetratricopeptide (TPR) repeat protein